MGEFWALTAEANAAKNAAAITKGLGPSLPPRELGPIFPNENPREAKGTVKVRIVVVYTVAVVAAILFDLAQEMVIFWQVE